MTRWRLLAMVGAPLSVAALCFGVSSVVGVQRTKLDAMRQQMSEDRAAIALLSAELLTRADPTRLQRMNELHLGLEPAQATQLFADAGQMVQVALATDQAKPDTAEPALPRIVQAKADVEQAEPALPRRVQVAEATMAASPSPLTLTAMTNRPLLDARTIATIDLAATLDRAVGPAAER